MFGNLGGVESFALLLVWALVWIVPIAMAVWLLRTLATMAAAQRDIARHLGEIVAHQRSDEAMRR